MSGIYPGDITRLEWTRELPTEPGWYWLVYFDGLDFEPPKCVDVRVDDFPEAGLLYVHLAGVEEFFRIDSFTNSWWLGPLPVPEVPK